MRAWYTLNLGDAMLAAEPMQQIQQQFHTEYFKRGKPRDMALYMRHETRCQLHCELILYFSPGAAMLAKNLGAIPCALPAAGSLALLAGTADANLPSN